MRASRYESYKCIARRVHYSRRRSGALPRGTGSVANIIIRIYRRGSVRVRMTFGASIILLFFSTNPTFRLNGIRSAQYLPLVKRPKTHINRNYSPRWTYDNNNYNIIKHKVTRYANILRRYVRTHRPATTRRFRSVIKIITWTRDVLRFFEIKTYPYRVRAIIATIAVLSCQELLLLLLFFF